MAPKILSGLIPAKIFSVVFLIIIATTIGVYEDSFFPVVNAVTGIILLVPGFFEFMFVFYGKPVWIGMLPIAMFMDLLLSLLVTFEIFFISLAGVYKEDPI
jgi:hypothetical protein